MRWLSTRCARTAVWLLFVLTTAGLFGSIQHEGNVREEQLCGVVIHVHHNNVVAAANERSSLEGTREYLADPESKADSPALYARVKKNLPLVEARVKSADEDVKATRVPPVCMKYTHKES